MNKQLIDMQRSSMKPVYRYVALKQVQAAFTHVQSRDGHECQQDGLVLKAVLVRPL
jgi:hypothetical protein